MSMTKKHIKCEKYVTKKRVNEYCHGNCCHLDVQIRPLSGVTEMDRPVVTTSNTGEMDSAGGTGGGV